MYIQIFTTHDTQVLSRVLLATIKFLAEHPCATCLTTKKDVPDMGSRRDEQRRRTLRIDDNIRRQKIELTRTFIFEKGYPVGHDAINNILDSQSLVPVRVRHPYSPYPIL